MNTSQVHHLSGLPSNSDQDKKKVNMSEREKSTFAYVCLSPCF